MNRKSIPLVLVLSCSWPLTAGAADLLQVYELSLKNDPNVATIQAQYEAAIEAKPQARSQVLPLIYGSAEVLENSTEIKKSQNPAVPAGASFDYGTSFFGVQLNQTVFDWGVFASLKQADALVAAAEATYKSAQQEQVMRVATRYFNVLAKEDDLRTAQAEKASIAGQLDRSRKRFEVGFSPVLDVQEAQARFDLATASEIESQRQLRRAREELVEVTGRAPGTLAGLRDEMPLEGPNPLDPEKWVQLATTQNYRIRGAQLQSEIAKQEIERQTGGHYPALDLVANYGISDQSEAPFGSETEGGAIGLQLAVPIYAGGGVQSKVRQATKTYDQRMAELELARREATHLTRDAYDGVVAGISQVQALRQAVTSSRTALDTTEAGFKVGIRTAVDTLDARSALYRAERDYAKSRYNYLLNVLLLKQAAGQLSVEDVKKVNSFLAAGELRPSQPAGITPAASDSPPGATVAPEPAINPDGSPKPAQEPASTPKAAPAPAPKPPGSTQ